MEADLFCLLDMGDRVREGQEYIEGDEQQLCKMIHKPALIGLELWELPQTSVRRSVRDTARSPFWV